MKIFQCFLFLGLLIISQQVHGQQLSNRFEQILKKYYSDPNGPGAIVYYENQGKIEQASIGLANLEKKEKIHTTTNFRMASVSKQFTAFAIYYLIRNNALDLQDSIKYFFPTLSPQVGAITIQQLLNHSSGVIDYEDIMNQEMKDQLSDREVFEIIRYADQLFFEPGTSFRYSNTAYCLLALIVEIVAEMPYAEVMKMIFFDPLEIQNTQLFEAKSNISNRAYGYHVENAKYSFGDQSATSATLGDGGVYTSAVDYRKWLMVIQEQIDHDDSQPPYLAQSAAYPVNDEIQYAYGWFIGKDKEGEMVLFHSGESTGFHNIVVFYPKSGKSLTLFSNRDDMKIAPLFEELMQLLKIEIVGVGKEPLFQWLTKVYAHEN